MQFRNVLLTGIKANFLFVIVFSRVFSFVVLFFSHVSSLRK